MIELVRSNAIFIEATVLDCLRKDFPYDRPQRDSLRLFCLFPVSIIVVLFISIMAVRFACAFAMLIA